MAPRRQRLSQRRKTVGLTQESLAQRLGVERSTVVRWEAGDTEPLPSIRPKVARALRVSTDQLAELLSEYENADTPRALPANAEVTAPMLLPKVQSEVWLDRAEFEGLVRPQVAETGEASRSADAGSGFPADIALPANVNTADADIRLDTPFGAGGFAGPGVPEPTRTDVPDLSSVTTIPLNLPLADIQWRRAGSRRFKRFAAAGVLALVGAAASASFMTSGNGPIPAAPETPMAAIPAPDPGSDNTFPSQDSTGAPAAAQDTPADGLGPSGPAAVPTPQTTRSGDRTPSRSKPPAATKTPPPPPTPAIPAEADVWSRIAELSGR
ncbi:MAG: helix-turn-helix domain-containing protein [Pseudonocardiaceae bacterium]